MFCREAVTSWSGPELRLRLGQPAAGRLLELQSPYLSALQQAGRAVESMPKTMQEAKGTGRLCIMVAESQGDCVL